MVQDDPAFLPELALPGLDIDLSSLDISTDGSSRRSSLLGPHSQRSSISSTHESGESMPELIIPSSGTGDGGSIGGFVLPGDDRGSAQRQSRMGILAEEEGFDLDPGLPLTSRVTSCFMMREHLNRQVLLPDLHLSAWVVIQPPALV